MPAENREVKVLGYCNIDINKILTWTIPQPNCWLRFERGSWKFPAYLYNKEGQHSQTTWIFLGICHIWSVFSYVHDVKLEHNSQGGLFPPSHLPWGTGQEFLWAGSENSSVLGWNPRSTPTSMGYFSPSMLCSEPGKFSGLSGSPQCKWNSTALNFLGRPPPPILGDASSVTLTGGKKHKLF